MRLVTIGIYRWTETRFFVALRDAEVKVLVDIRRRRGVRGAQCACSQ